LPDGSQAIRRAEWRFKETSGYGFRGRRSPHRASGSQEYQLLDAIRAIGCQRPCDARSECVTDDGDRPTSHRLDHRGDIEGEIMIGNAVQRTSTASDAPRLRQNCLIACAHESGAEVLEIFDAASS
jgi:hypothetical protein